MNAAWRTMRADDLPAVLALAGRVHPAHPEAPEVFAEKRALYPAGCRVAEQGGTTVAYAIAHPGLIGAPPALDRLMGALPAAPDCLYIHDVAVVPECAGQGIGRAALDGFLALARSEGLSALALVAVNHADGFWGRLGFATVDDPRLADKLAGYGAGARYMVRKLPDGL